MVQITEISFTFFCASIVLAIGIAIPILIQQLIESGARESVLMTSANQNLWASVPGESGVEILRNFTFYDFDNFYQVLFGKQKPLLIEQNVVSYQEQYDFIDKIYSDDGERVHFYQQIKFPPTFDTTGKEKLKSLKLGTMGAWYQMKNADMAQIALSAFSELFISLKEQMIPSVVASAVQQFLFPDADSTENILKNHVSDKISEEQMNRLNSDPNFSISKEDTFYNWILMSCDFSQEDIQLAKPTNGAWTFLQNYFGLTSNQMKDIQSIIWSGTKLKPIKPTGAKTIFNQIVSGYYCEKKYPDLPCNGDTLAAAQWTGQGVSFYPPSIPLVDIPPIPSIADTNSTLFGFPEISYYYEKCFQQQVDSCKVQDGENEEFENQFTNSQQMAKWGIMAMETLNDGEFIKAQTALLNIGNLNELFKLGSQFDNEKLNINNYKESKNLIEFQQRLKLQTIQQAFIFWNYMKYFVECFAEMKEWNGNAESAALGSLVSGGLTDQFVDLVDTLQPYIISKILQDQYKKKNCEQVFEFFDEQIALNICFKYLKNEKILTNSNTLNIIQVCTNQNQEQVDQFLELSGLDGEIDGLSQFNTFCTDTQADNTFAENFYKIGVDLSQKYGCEIYGMTCSNWDLALIQWSTSQVTYDHAPCMGELFTKSYSISDWPDNKLQTPFEYGWFIQQYGCFSDGEIQKLDFETTLDLISYNKLLSGTMISAGFLWEMSDQDELKQKFEQIFYFKDGTLLLNYFRYITLEITFGGFIIEKTADEFLFGYQDEFLEMMKTINPQEGGDPSIETIVQFNEPNMTQKYMAENLYWAQEMYTGVGQIENIRQFYSVADRKHIYVTQDMFDGNQTYTAQFSPYAEEVPIVGTDGTAFKPNLKENESIDVYIPSLFVGKTLEYTGKVKNNGLECLRFQTNSTSAYGNSTTNPDNAVYYADGPNGVVNMTGAIGAPLFNSQTHFYEGDEDLINNITILKNNKMQLPSKWDETYIDVEKYSGTVLSVVLNIQVNYEMQPDLLFPVDYPRYIPVYWMYRASNWTDSQADAQFGDLKTGLNIKIIIQIVGISLGSILFILGFAMIYKYRVQKKKSSKGKNNKDKQILNLDTENNSNQALITQSDYEENYNVVSNIITKKRVNNNDRSEYNQMDDQ